MGEAYNLVVSICLNVLKGVKKKLYENVDAQKEPSRHLRAPVQGRCDGRQEGSLCAQASGIGERSQPPRHQSLPATLNRAPRGPPGAGGERDQYRRGGDKTGDAGAGASQGFEFRGGFGRGKPAATE